MLKHGTRFAVGFLTFLAAHAIERAEWQGWFHGEYEPWFLNAGRAVLFTVACVVVAGAVVAALTRSATPVRGIAIGTGAFAAMTAVLFLKEGGPGTIFPIVLVAGGGLIFLGSAAGAWIGNRFGRLTRGNG